MKHIRNIACNLLGSGVKDRTVRNMIVKQSMEQMDERLQQEGPLWAWATVYFAVGQLYEANPEMRSHIDHAVQAITNNQEFSPIIFSKALH